MGRGRGRYMKGRLPEGVDFKAYPGRSSTPLPTAESKGAERINQLKIWNEAATNDDKRGLRAAQGKQALTAVGSGSRRTDSFRDAKERHSASFQGSDDSGGAHTNHNPPHVKSSNKADMFADPSDDSEDDVPEQNQASFKDVDESAEVPKLDDTAVPTNTPLGKQDAHIPGGTNPVVAPDPEKPSAAVDAGPGEGDRAKKHRACCSIQ